MNDEPRTPTGNLDPLYHHYERQKCFIGYSPDAEWGVDLVDTCNEVLAEFDMDPWYESEHFDPTQSLRDKVVEMIANTRCGIYDLSYWRKDNKGEWHLPCNVFIELGIAIALNRPLLMLRHTNNTVAQLSLPQCLESVSTSLVEFNSLIRLKQTLHERLSQWQKTEPEKDWWNRYCTFGNRLCEYREAHPHLRQWGQEKLHCHISDGQDGDQVDFRDVVESVLGNFDNVTFRYLDWLPQPEGYTFRLCALCQAIRSSPFAIYRISDQTPAETFMAIGMSLALETQFEQKIPKIVRTAHAEDIPSLLAGYDVVVAQDNKKWRKSLRKFTPQIIRQVRKSTWKARPLPFIEARPDPDEQLAPAASPDQETADDYLAVVGKYGLIKEIERSEIAVTYLVRDTEKDQLYTMKRLHSSFASDSRSVTRFHREADILCKFDDPHVLRGIEQGEDGTVPYVIMEYVEGQTLRQLIDATGPLAVARAINYAHQIAEGLDAAYNLDIAHHDLGRENILVASQDQVKIIGFGSEHEREVDERTQTRPRPTSFSYNIAPEVIERSRNTDIRSDLYALATMFFDMLTGQPPFRDEDAVAVMRMHLSAPVPSLCRLRADLLGVFDLFMQKAMAKSPADRYQTPAAFIAALDHLQQAVALAPPGNRTRVPVKSSIQGIPPLVGTTLGQYRIFDSFGSPGVDELIDFFKAFEPARERTVTMKVFLPAFFEEAEKPDLDEGVIQELRSLTSLSHPNLVPLYDLDVQNNRLYIVEEYVDGESFKSRLVTPIELQKAVAYVLQAAEGLTYLHDHDLVYPNVQTENMVLRDDDRLLLPNWEMLKVFKTVVHALYPTNFSELESELEGLAVDQYSNMYSLGITLVDCLTSGSPSLTPAYGATFQDSDQAVRIWDLRAAHVPVEIQQVIVKMTRKQPEERYQSMQEGIDALRAALASGEQTPQEERTEEHVGMDRCAFCDAATTPEDERCANCGNRLLPEPTPPSAQWWGQSPPPAAQWPTPAWGQPPPTYPYNPAATIPLNICPTCGEDFQPGNTYCLNCRSALTPRRTLSTTLTGSSWSSAPSAPLAPQIRFCPTCGAATSNATYCEHCGRPRPIVTVCTYCHAISQPGDTYCMNCGTQLAPTSPVYPDPWAAPPAPDSWASQPGYVLVDDAGAYPDSSLFEGHIINARAPAPPAYPDPWAPPSAPYAGTTRPLADAWASQPATPNAWGSPWGAQPPTPPPQPSRPQEIPTVQAADAGNQVPSPDLTGQFATAWTGGPARSTFTLEDLNNIGKTFGDYRILREIGQGGLGRVYLALHTVSHQPAAVKLFYSHLSAKQRQQLFFLEAQVLDHLHHPYILPIIEVNLHDDPRYLITDYAQLGSLHERIQSGQPLPTESAVTILSQVGEALAHIHQQNIVHRDLKPGNILFNDRNEALLSDFDIAVVLDTGESKKVEKWGSPPYMAPEQFDGVVSRKSDQYSLGCIAYRLFTGRRPFDDTHLIALQFKHGTQVPVAPRRLNPTIPKHIEQAILRTMSKDPADRFPDMRAFIDAIRSAHGPSGQWQHQVSLTAPSMPVMNTEGGPPAPVVYEASPSIPEGDFPYGSLSAIPGGDTAEEDVLHQGPTSQQERVLVEVDGHIVKEQPLSQSMFTVGRAPTSDIVVPVESVSRLHARIRWESGAWLIEDINSLNGIVYQGNRIERCVLKNGDRIMLAPSTILHFTLRASTLPNDVGR